MNKSNKNTTNKVDESFFHELESELNSFSEHRASLGKVGAKTIAKGSGTADDPYLGEDASRYTMVADMIQIAEKLDKPVHFVHEGHGYVATIRGVMESEEFEGLDDLDEAKVSPGTTKDDYYGAWILRYDLRPITGSKEYRGKAWHAKSTKTPPISLTGSSVDDVRSKLVATIDSTKSQKAIDPSKRVMIDFNVLTTKDIIGHKDAIYGDVELIDNMPTLLISAEQPGGFQVATDRTSVAQRAEHKTGQHAFSLSGRKAIAAGLTHARYALGAPFDYSEGVTAYPLKFSSEVHPGEVIRLNEPGVTVAYPRDVSEEVNEDGVFEGIFSKEKKEDYQPLTSQQRDLIRKFFAGRGTNVDVVFEPGRYVLPHNALGHHNNTVFRFYNESGKLMCGIEYYRTAQEAGDIKAAPLTHISDVEVKGPWDLEALMKKYGGEFNESDNSSEDIVEDNGYQFEGAANELYAELKDGMLDIVDEYKGKAVKGYSQPAAPDSTKFSAAVGGMIEYATNIHIHGGRTSFPKTYKMFIKVGSAVDEQTKNDINTQFAEYVNVITGKHLDETITTDDGYRFSFGSEEFTNWGGIGVIISPPKAKVSESNEVKFVTRDITNVKELHEHTEQKAKAMFEHGDISLESYKGTTRTDGSWKAGFAQRVRSGLRRLTNESASHTDIKSFIDRLKQVDLSPNGKIEKGQKLAVINFDIIFAWEEIELSGFTTPKTIVDITWTPDKTIKLITFDDGDTYPRHNKVTYHGKPTDYSVFFQTQEKAESTLTMLTLALPDGWEITDNNINSKKVSEATEGKAKIRGYKDRNGVKKYEVLNAVGIRVKGDMSKEMADDYLRNHRSELQEGGTNAGIIKVNMTQMKKWKVDQDNVRYYDHIIKNKGSIQTLDTRPYLEYLNQFGIFYTGPNINEDDYSIADMDPDYEEEEEPNVFYVAIYDEDENTTFVGKLANGGRRWQESNVAGTPPYNWPCHGYMGYLSAGDVMSWIYKDYSRGHEVKGPFYSKDAAIQWAEHNFGPLGESQVTEAKRLPGESEEQFLDRKAADYVANGPAKPARQLEQPGAKNKDQVRKEYSNMIKDAPIAEAKHGISKRVRVVAGPAKGKMGYVGEIRHGAYKGAPKEYTIDLDDGGNVRCSAKELRLVKDEPIEEGYWDEAMKKFEKDSEARKGKTFEKNPLSHDKNGVYKGDKDLDGNPVKKVDESPVQKSGTFIPKEKYTNYDECLKDAKRIAKRDYTTICYGQNDNYPDNEYFEIKDNTKSGYRTIGIWNHRTNTGKIVNNMSRGQWMEATSRVTESEWSKNPSGTWTNNHTGRSYSQKGGGPDNGGNSSYMTPEYMLAHYKKRLADIEASPYKRAREVARLKSKIAKLEGSANVTEAADPQKKIASLEKQYDTLRGRLGMAKDKRRMKGDRLLSPAEQKIMSKMSEVQSQIYQLKADANKAPVEEAIKFSKGAYPDVDHMNGSVIRDWGDTPKKQVIPFKNRSAWETTAQKANSELYDDNAEIISMGVLREYEIDGKVFARWIETTSSGWVQTTPINESVVTEKSKSAKQARFMAAAAHDPKFAKKVGIKQSVAKEFNQADKGTALLKKATSESEEVVEAGKKGMSAHAKEIAASKKKYELELDAAREKRERENGEKFHFGNAIVTKKGTNESK